MLGVLIIIPIGGADMPVVISMLNSYSGWAASGIGFSLNNPLLIVAGALVGSSGAILSYIMCKAMNRSFFSVILGGFGAAEGACRGQQPNSGAVKSGSPDDVAFLLGNAESVIIIPGLRAGRRARAARREGDGAEADRQRRERPLRDPPCCRPHARAHERPARRSRSPRTTRCWRWRTSTATSARATSPSSSAPTTSSIRSPRQPGSPIYGMPILEAHKARTVVVNKRSMASGYAGIDNPLFYMDKTMMVFGDAKKVVEDIVKAIE